MRPNLTGRTPNPNKPENRRGRVLFINADAEYLAGRAQNYLRPENIEKVSSTFEQYDEVEGYSRAVTLEEITGTANDYNLNIRRYVDNSPPPEPHDVRAHLVGGVPIVEISSHRPLFEALGFNPDTIFTARKDDARYQNFSNAMADRSAIASLIENDADVQARIQSVRKAFATWWTAHSQSLADLPQGRNLNAVRTLFLKSFNQALLPMGVLDRFKLAGVIAAWWTDTLPDFKTLIENGFCGVVDGWVDAIADAVEDDDSVGPAFDPYSHKLVKRTMADYLQQIDEAKSEIARLKGEKEAFEQSNPPDDADEEELASWSQAKDIERRIKELKLDYKDALKELKKLEKSATKKNATDSDRKAAEAARRELQPFFDQAAALETELAPYEKIKSDLAVARATFRALTNAFVDELKSRCALSSDEEKKMLVLELFAQDLQAGLDAAVMEKRQKLVWFIENLWDKYQVTLEDLQSSRNRIGTRLNESLGVLGYL